MTLLGGNRSRLPSHGPFVCRSGATIRRRDLLATSVSPRAVDHWCISVRCRDLELSADDLRTWRGVVLGRAVSTLRSVETQPLAWGFVLVERRDPAVCCVVLCCVGWLLLRFSTLRARLLCCATLVMQIICRLSMVYMYMCLCVKVRLRARTTTFVSCFAKECV